MPTIRDVAREAGVGVGTVSRVLGDHPRVAPATRARVEDAVRRLGYRPSPAARALARGQSHTLEVVMPLITRHGYVELLRGIEDGLAESDYALVIRTIERPAARERAFADLGHTSRADGIIFVNLVPPEAVIDRLRQARVPVVLVDRAHPDLPWVAVDHAAAAAAAVRGLIELGHRRIALVDHPAGGADAGSAGRSGARLPGGAGRGRVGGAARIPADGGPQPRRRNGGGGNPAGAAGAADRGAGGQRYAGGGGAGGGAAERAPGAA